MTRINYHKDHYNKEQILPRERFEELRIQAGNVDQFSQYGEPDLAKVEYDQGKKTTLKDLYISKLELEDIMDNINLVKYTDVFSGYEGNYNNKMEDTFGYGGYNYALFIEHNQVNVTNIWLYNIDYFETKVLKTILTKLGNRWNLLLMDAHDTLIELNNESQIEKYLRNKQTNKQTNKLLPTIAKISNHYQLPYRNLYSFCLS